MKRLNLMALLTMLYLYVGAAEFNTGNGCVSVTFFSPDIVHVMKTTGTAPSLEAQRGKGSLAVTMTPMQVKVKQKETAGKAVLSTGALTVTVDLQSGKVAFSTPQGKQLLQEGEWQLTPIAGGLDRGCAKVKSNFRLGPGEELYGIGLMENNKLNLRGEHRRMIQTNLEDFQNVFQSIKGYAFFWDNYSPTQLDDSADGGLTLSSEVGRGVDYYFMYGKSGDGNVALMRQLTGQAPMLPLWSYGFWQSRERYQSQKQLTDVVAKYRSMGVPIDGIIQDWQYWDNNYLWNAMEFLSPNYPDPKGMMDYLRSQKVHLALSIWQSFGPATKPFRELKGRNLLFGFETWPQSGLAGWPPRMDYPSGVRVYKPYSSEARDIYWKYLRRLYDLGTDMWWMDSTDPDHHSYKESDLDVPAAIDGMPAGEGSYRRVRNAFPLECCRGVYEHQRATQDSALKAGAPATADKRVVILTRSGFAGQQRYGACVWTGDVTSRWQNLRNQIPMTLNFTLTGNPYVNTDIGGFFSGSYNKSYSDAVSGTRNPQFQELYTRWMQFGAFCPMMRSHGTETYRELYYYGKPGQPVYDALRAAIGLRYRLLPYIYGTAWEVSHKQGSFMRALWMDFADDSRTHDMKYEYMFGRQLLVAPIVTAQYTPEEINADYAAGKTTVDFTQTRQTRVYLPAGTTWYDYWNGTHYEGGRLIDLQTTLQSIPLYVRAGSIVPVAAESQNVEDRDWAKLELHVYPGADGHFTLYEDDGKTYAYEKGQFTEIPLAWNDKAHTLTIGSRVGSYGGMTGTRYFTVLLPNGTAKTVNYKGRKMQVKM